MTVGGESGRRSRRRVVAWAWAPLLVVGAAAVLMIAGPGARASVACTISWDGGAATTSWHDAVNWDTNAVPGATDVVCIPDLPGTVTVVVSSDASVKGVVSSETLSITGGTLSFTDAAVPSSTTTMSMTGGTLDGDGSLSVTSTFTWSGGTMQGAGVTTLEPAAALTMSGGSLRRTMFTKGTSTVTAMGWSIASGGDWENSASMTFPQPPGDGRLFAGGLFHNTSTGAITFNGGVQVEVAFDNDGAVSVKAGVRFVGGDGAGSSSGTTTVTAAGTLDLAADANHSYEFDASSSITGAGILYAEQGNSTFDGTVSVATIRVGAETATLNTDVTVPTLKLEAGVLAGTGDISVTSTFTWAGGTMQGAGVTTLEPAAALTMSGGSLRRTFLTKGTSTVTAMGWSIGSGGDWENSASMTFPQPPATAP